VKGVGLNRKILIHFGDMIVWNGNDGSDRIFNARDSVMNENVKVGIVKGVAALV
jgi:hypothetical protein